MSNIVNLTPHPLSIHCRDGEVRVLAPTGVVARVSGTRWRVGDIEIGDGHTIPVTQLVLRLPRGLPAPEDGTFYAVSRMVADAARDRDDLLVPDDAVRNADGHIIGQRCFGWFGAPERLDPFVRRVALERQLLVQRMRLDASQRAAIAPRLQAFDEQLASLRRLAGELEADIVALVLEELARSSAVDTERIRTALREHAAFEPARAALGRSVVTHPGFVRWLATPVDGGKTIFAVLHDGEHQLVIDSDLLDLKDVAIAWPADTADEGAAAD